MGKTLERLEVVVAGSISKYKQAMNEAKQITSKFANETSEQLKKIKGPAFDSDESMKSFRNMQRLIRKTVEDIKSGALPKGLASEIKEYAKTAQLAAGIKVYSDDYIQLANDIEKAENKLNQLISRQQKMEALGVDKQSRGWKSLLYDIEEARNTVNAYKQDADNMRLSGEDTQFAKPVSMSTGGYLQTAGVTAQHALNGVSGKLQEIRTNIAETVKRFPILGRVATESAYVASKAFGGLRSVFEKVAPAIKKAGGAFASLLKRFSNGIPILNRFGNSMKSTGQSGRRLGGIMNTLAMSARFMFASFVLRGAVDGAKEGLKNLAQYSGTTNQSISMLMSSMAQLKNAFATAFAPILNVAAPILNTLINLISRAVTAIGMLFATLTGQSTFIRAKEVQQDYAASLNSSAGSADKANAANQKLQRTLLGFDEINKLDDDSSSGAGGSGGGGSGGLSPWDMFEEVPIDNSISSFGQKLKEAWAAADFTGIGQIIGDKVNEALENIPWDEIKATSSRIALSVATLLNGFIGATDWNLVGGTLAEGINTAIEFGYAFVTTFDWNVFGNAISDAFNGMFANIDWMKAGQSLSGCFDGLLKTILAVIKNTDWSQVGTSIGSFINGIDWQSIINDYLSIMFGLPKVILDALVGAVKSVDWGQAVKDIPSGIYDALVSADWKGTFRSAGELVATIIVAAFDIGSALYEMGEDVVAGFEDGILEGFKGIGRWIKENIFQPFIDGFKDAFGIHSPSKVMIELGIFVIQGFFDGAREKFQEVLDWFKDIPDKIREAVGKLDWFGGLNLGSDKKTTAAGLLKGAISLPNTIGAKVAASVGIETTPKQLKSDVTELGKKSKLGVDAAVNADSITTGLEELLDEYRFDMKVNAVLDSVKDKINYRDKKLTDFSARLDKGSDNIKSKTLSSFVARLDSQKDNIGGKTLTSFIARLDGKTDNIGSKTLKSFVARLDSKSDNIGSKLLTAFMARVDSKSDNIKDRWLGNISAVVTRLDKGSNLKLNMSGVVVSGSGQNRLVATLKKDGGLFKNGSWHPVTAYAGGGSPTMGQMFIAREAGPELVGRIGSSTAVMNNDQIVSSVSAGVYQAFLAAMAAFGNTGNTAPTFNIYVGGKKVTDVVIEEINNRTNATGKSPLLI